MTNIIKSTCVINKKTKQILMNIPRKQISPADELSLLKKKKVRWILEGFE